MPPFVDCYVGLSHRTRGGKLKSSRQEPSFFPNYGFWFTEIIQNGLLVLPKNKLIISPRRSPIKAEPNGDITLIFPCAGSLSWGSVTRNEASEKSCIFIRPTFDPTNTVQSVKILVGTSYMPCNFSSKLANSTGRSVIGRKLTNFS